MKRLLNAWPYALATLILALAVGLLPSGPWCSVPLVGCGPEAGIGFMLVALAVVAPVGLFAIGAFLGFRRGYDWASVVVCVVIVAVATGALFGIVRDVGQGWFWSSLAADLVPLVGYALVLNLGVAAGMGVYALIRSGRGQPGAGQRGGRLSRRAPELRSAGPTH